MNSNYNCKEQYSINDNYFIIKKSILYVFIRNSILFVNKETMIQYFFSKLKKLQVQKRDFLVTEKSTYKG